MSNHIEMTKAGPGKMPWFEDAAYILELWNAGFTSPEISKRTGFVLWAVKKIVVRAQRKGAAKRGSKLERGKGAVWIGEAAPQTLRASEDTRGARSAS